MNYDIEVVDIVREERHLRCTWSQEAMDDLRAVHNLDAEGSLMDILEETVLGFFTPVLPSNKVNWKKEGF